MSWTTADLFDDYDAVLHACQLQMKNYGKRGQFCGFVETVSVYEDNALVKDVLTEPGKGRVLVIDGGGSLRTALLGGNMATMAMQNGWAGIVLYGAVRDTLELAEIEIGIKAMGSNPRRSGKQGEGLRGISMAFGESSFEPGAIVASDADGIAVLPQTADTKLLAEVAARLRLE